MKDNKGFTMVELLAVIVVLAIMMGIAIPAVTHYVNKGKDSYYENQKRNLIAATKSYMNNTSLRPTRVGDFYDVSLKELIDKKYIDGMKDANKMDCFSEAQNVAGGDYSSYTFVRVIKTRNNYKYIAHLSCPNYQDEPLNDNSAQMEFLVSKDTPKQSNGMFSHYYIDVQIFHKKQVNGTTLTITDYTYRLYKNDSLILSGTEVVGSSNCEFQYDIMPYLTSGSNTFKLAISALDERGRIGSKIETVSVNTKTDSALRCGATSITSVGTSKWEYKCTCLSTFGCKSRFYSGISTTYPANFSICDVLDNCETVSIP